MGSSKGFEPLFLVPQTSALTVELTRAYGGGRRNRTSASSYYAVLLVSGLSNYNYSTILAGPE